MIRKAHWKLFSLTSMEAKQKLVCYLHIFLIITNILLPLPFKSAKPPGPLHNLLKL